MLKNFHEGILQNIVGIVMVQYDIPNVIVQRPLVKRQEFLKRVVLRFGIQQLIYKCFFFQQGLQFFFGLGYVRLV